MGEPQMDVGFGRSSSIQQPFLVERTEEPGCLSKCRNSVARGLNGCWGGIKWLGRGIKSVVKSSQGSLTLALANSGVVGYALYVDDVTAGLFNLFSTGLLIQNFHVYRELEITERGTKDPDPLADKCCSASRCFFRFLGYKADENRQGILDFISRLIGVIGNHPELFGRIPQGLSSPALSNQVHEIAELIGALLLGMGANSEIHELLKTKKIEIEIKKFDYKTLTIYLTHLGMSATAITVTFTLDMKSEQLVEVLRQLAIWLTCRIPAAELLKKVHAHVTRQGGWFVEKFQRVLCATNASLSLSIFLLNKFPDNHLMQLLAMVPAGFSSGFKNIRFKSKLAALDRLKFKHLKIEDTCLACCKNISCCQKIQDFIRRRWRSILLFVFALQDILDKQKTNTQGIYYEGATCIMSGLCMYDLRVIGRYSDHWFGRGFVDITDQYQPDLIFATVYLFLRVLPFYPEVAYPLLAMTGSSLGISAERFYHGSSDQPESRILAPEV